MKSKKMVFPLRFYINICEDGAPKFVGIQLGV